MVSNTLNIQVGELLDMLAGMRAEFSDDPDYQELRACLPEGWPL